MKGIVYHEHGSPDVLELQDIDKPVVRDDKVLVRVHADTRTPSDPGGVSKGLRWVLLAAVLVLVLAACTAGANPSVDVPSAEGEVTGFWLGLWHGIIVPITFIISLFSETVSIYEIHNNGGWYDFGFVVGAGVFLGGSGAGAKGMRRR